METIYLTLHVQVDEYINLIIKAYHKFEKNLLIQALWPLRLRMYIQHLQNRQMNG